MGVWLAFADDRDGDRVTTVLVSAGDEEDALNAADEAMVLVGRGHSIVTAVELDLPVVLHINGEPHSVFGEDVSSGGPSPEAMAEDND